MATATTTIGGTNRSSDSFVRRAFGRMVEAREKQARRYVNGYLLSLDDATLAAHGFERSELEREGTAGMIF
ncbi:hypothetical protein [Roseibium polysiphoniae]|uniref:DUF1127 domain-containing protein n=1 Tax=Roseibium polysiphoniae TaxID=2571221 RepID=A0ABR9C8T2_9HYPH|nr:hypothetical protein [Roseibium polysiphoniae]MBD8876295.1 hypothetical protein [Roseibium polysiphoniae]